MQKTHLLLLLFILPFSNWAQGIEKVETIFEDFARDSFYQKEILEQSFDKKGRLIKETYTDISDPRERKKEIKYTYRGKKKRIIETTYSMKGVPQLPEPVTSKRQTIIKKKLSPDSFIEEVTSEDLVKQPFYYTSNLEEFDDFGLEGAAEGTLFDISFFGIPTQISNKKDISYAVIHKKFPKEEDKFLKASFDYYVSGESRSVLELFKGTFYEKQKDNTIKRYYATFIDNPLRYVVEGAKILNKKGDVIRQAALKYEYEYDSNGNWVTKTKIYNKKPLDRIIRKITYK